MSTSSSHNYQNSRFMRKLAKSLNMNENAPYDQVVAKLGVTKNWNLDVHDIYDHHNKDDDDDDTTYTYLMQHNTAGLKGKLYSRQAAELWAMAYNYNVSGMALQDHGMAEANGRAITQSVKYAIPGYGEPSLAMAEGLKGVARKNVGGAALLLGGLLATYSTKEIKDPRGWGRFAGRIVVGKTKYQPKLSDRKEATKIAIIAYYGPVGPGKEGSMWNTQQRRMHSEITDSEREDNPKKQGLAEICPPQ